MGFFTPGDKVAKCPFCGAMVDLPDDKTETKEKVTSFDEQKSGLGYQVKRSVRVVEKSNVSSRETNEAPADLMNEVKDMMEKMQGRSGANVQTVTNNDQSVVVTTMSDSRSGDGMDLLEGDLPDDMKKMIADAGIDFSSMQTSTSAKPKKKSFWRRLFGKS